MAKRRSSGMEPEDKGVQGFHSPREGIEGGRGVGEQGPQSKGLGSTRPDKEADAGEQDPDAGQPIERSDRGGTVL